MHFFSRKPAATDGLGRTLSASKRSWVRANFRNPHTPTGLVLGEHEQGTAVVGVLPSSPAEQQGVPVGGLILTVNGEEVVGLPPEAVEVLIETEQWPITINPQAACGGGGSGQGLRSGVRLPRWRARNSTGLEHGWGVRGQDFGRIALRYVGRACGRSRPRGQR